KDVIRRAGENISSLEIEEIIAKNPLVKEAIVVPQADDVIGERICALIVLKDIKQSLTLDDLRAHCAIYLADFKLPERVVFTTEEDIPRTASGNVRKPILAKWIHEKNE